MGGYLLLAGFLICGILTVDGIASKRDRLTRLWLGLCAGFIMMMWFPALAAFFMRFTVGAQWIGLTAAGFCAAGSLIACAKRKRCRTWTKIPIPMLLALLIPFTLLSGYLQYTHTLRDVDGALHVGQSTYGDLCLHLGIATSLRNAAFPPEYSLLQGTLLGYPFLADSMVTSMLLFGSDLAASFIVTGTLMMLLVYTGFLIFTWEICGTKTAAALSYLMMFINGGLGFIYVIDRALLDPTAFREVFAGFYRAPTNMPDDHNLRWVNVICDMMIPQRTLLTGWMALIPAIWMLVHCMNEHRTAGFVCLGIWAGALPMIHTHSFMALGLLSAGCMIRNTLSSETRRRTLLQFLLYGGIAVLLALPQLMTWTFPQTVGGGSLSFRFNWSNNRGDGRLIDEYFWFWIKNVGPVWLLMIPAALNQPKGGAGRGLALGALFIYTVAELIQFQPNPYDNNKLFYVAYMVMMPLVASAIEDIWRRLRGLPARGILAAVFIVCAFLSGVLTIARECVSDYRLFSPAETAAAAFIEAELPNEGAMLTGTQHNNAPAALCGRTIVCGTGSYLYYHGLDYSEESYAAGEMYQFPADSAELFEKYGVRYVYLSSYERRNYDVDAEWFDQSCTSVFENDEVIIYRLEQ